MVLSIIQQRRKRSLNLYLLKLQMPSDMIALALDHHHVKQSVIVVVRREWISLHDA